MTTDPMNKFVMTCVTEDPGMQTSRQQDARLVLPHNTGLERAKTAWAELQRAWETVLWQTKTRDYSLQPSRQRTWDPPPRAEQRGGAPRRRRCSYGRRKTSALLLDQGAQPGEQAENGTEPPHAPSSVAEPSNPWRSPAYHSRGPILVETFCQDLCNGGPRNADEQAA
ncbi:hypothetical protein CRENBAI_010629 [Crenichthys baileyi]|uniref:Uncharacterized protein n=1 Tax=Crenichthys baileyi TaxID=28760 RepID=A0AAV9S0V8_9TELE